MSKARRSRRSGVTIIEAMVAISILAIIATLVWGGFSQTTRNKKRVERDLDRHHVVTAALERMARELSMAFVSAHVNGTQALQTVITAFVGKDRTGGDRIDFTSFSHRRLYRNAHESDQNELSYFLMPDPDDSSNTVLARREQNRVDDQPQRGGRISILVRDVEDLEFEYLDPLSTNWVRGWDTTQAAGQPNRLPTQIKIRLTIPNLRGQGPSQTFGTRAVLPITYALNHAIYNP